MLNQLQMVIMIGFKFEGSYRRWFAAWQQLVQSELVKWSQLKVLQTKIQARDDDDKDGDCPDGSDGSETDRD